MNESGQGPKKEGGSCVPVNHKRGKAIIKEIQGGKGGKTIKTRLMDHQRAMSELHC